MTCQKCWCTPCTCSRSTVAAAAPVAAASFDLQAVAAAPGFAPQAWAPTAPQHLFTGYKPPVEWSDDLRRIIELPRRTPPEKGSPESLGLVHLMNSRLARPNANCECRAR